MSGFLLAGVWSLALVGLWTFLAVAFHVDSRQEVSGESPATERGNAVVVLAHTGYHSAAVGTVVVASLSPLAGTVAGALQSVTVSDFQAGTLTDVAVLGSYALLALAGVLAVYLGVRGPFLRTTEKHPPLGDSLLSLVQATGLHFLPASLVLLLVTVGRRPVVSGLLVALALAVFVPLLLAVHDRLVVDYSNPTAEERDIVTADPLPDDVEVRVGREEYDSHQLVVSRFGFDRPMVYLGCDVRDDLSDECIKTMARVAHEKSGWKYTLAARAPLGVWFGLTTAALIHVEAGFLASVVALVVAYYGYVSAVARVVRDRALSVPPDLDDERLTAMLAELRETQRVPLPGYTDPISVTAAGFARELGVDNTAWRRADEQASE
jgi:hypothetical protein